MSYVIQQRVKRGIKWLNENHPDWLDIVNIDLLNMANCDRRMLAQVLGHFSTEVFEGGIDQAVDLGFEAPNSQNPIPYYNQLEEEWLRQIKKLKK